MNGRLKLLAREYEGRTVPEWRTFCLGEATRLRAGTATGEGDLDLEEALLREYLAIDAERLPRRKDVN